MKIGDEGKGGTGEKRDKGKENDARRAEQGRMRGKEVPGKRGTKRRKMMNRGRNDNNNKQENWKIEKKI